ncbi:MAG: hypothetical protein MUO77_10705 [Anaerolineales bacterium]|nr:hypothetical protein [Anaerolineales bacterium]
MVEKFDVVIEAVRYKNGQILTARAYERRGATFSDRVLLDRKTIVDQIGNKKIFVTGQRRELLASTFEVGKSVKLVKHDGREVISTSDDTSHDNLEGVPAF